MGQIQSGQGTQEIEVLWTNTGNNGVFVSRVNFCGNGETSFIPVVVNQIPPINQISGEGKACVGPTYSYSFQRSLPLPILGQLWEERSSRGKGNQK